MEKTSTRHKFDTVRIDKGRMAQVLPQEILDSDALLEDDKKVLAALINYFVLSEEAREAGEFYLTDDAYRQSAGIAKGNWRQSRDNLARLGLISYVTGSRTGGRATVYKVNWEALTKPIKKLTFSDLLGTFLKGSKPLETPVSPPIQYNTSISTNINKNTIQKQSQDQLQDNTPTPISTSTNKSPKQNNPYATAVQDTSTPTVIQSQIENKTNKKRESMEPSSEASKDSSEDNIIRKGEKRKETAQFYGRKEERSQSVPRKTSSFSFPSSNSFEGVIGSEDYSHEDVAALKQELLEDEERRKTVHTKHLTGGSLLNQRFLAYKDMIGSLCTKYSFDTIREYVDQSLAREETGDEDTGLTADEVDTLRQMVYKSLLHIDS